jgi:hypothetical protein
MDLKDVTVKQLDQMEQLAKELLEALLAANLDSGSITTHLEGVIADVAAEKQRRGANALKQLPNWDNEGGSDNGNLKT